MSYILPIDQAMALGEPADLIIARQIVKEGLARTISDVIVVEDTVYAQTYLADDEPSFFIRVGTMKS